MATVLFLWFTCLLLVHDVYSVCPNPSIDATAYTTTDATILDCVAYVASFSMKCPDGSPVSDLSAVVGDRVVPVVTSADGSQYQVSWSLPLAKETRGQHAIHLYDEQGMVALAKAERTGAGTSSVKPVATVIVDHPGAYTGPMVNSEFIAASAAALVFYVAFSTRSRLLA